jgi:hypothetical protein
MPLLDLQSRHHPNPSSEEEGLFYMLTSTIRFLP